jgi:peptidoglycan/LPS O-acetylase OafA/YrhL
MYSGLAAKLNGTMSLLSNRYIVQLDGIRCLAVSLVLLGHLSPLTLPVGELGVNLFFVLSGFLISRILMQSAEQSKGKPRGFATYLRKFFIRRTLRIFPIYYLCIAVLYVVGEESVRDYWPWLVTYTTNLYIAVTSSYMGSAGHLWSLAVEEQVYLFFPFLLFFVARKRLLSVFGVMGAVSIVLRAYFYFSGKAWIVPYVTVLTCLDCFSLGGLMAFLQLYRKEVSNKLFSKSTLVIVSLSAWLLVYCWSHYGIEEKYNLVKIVLDRLSGAVFGFFLIGRAVVGYSGFMGGLFGNPVSVYLGRISYGIYLYHGFVISQFHKSDTHIAVRAMKKVYRTFPVFEGSGLFFAAVVVVSTVAIASISWFLIERPINRLKDRVAG